MISISGPISSGTPSMLNRHSFSQDFLSIQLIICITVVIKFNKSEPLFDENIRLATISLKKPLEVLFSCPRGQVPNVDPTPTPRHFEPCISLVEVNQAIL